MAAPVTDEVAGTLSAAIFRAHEPSVVEAYSAFDSELRAFRSPEELAEYLQAQRKLPEQSAHLAVYYPDMGGRLTYSRLRLEPEQCQGHTYRYSAAGWGLIWVHLDWRQSAAGSFISANSKKRATAWAHNSPELGAPEQWNWEAVGRHLRRLRRVLGHVA